MPGHDWLNRSARAAWVGFTLEGARNTARTLSLTDLCHVSSRGTGWLASRELGEESGIKSNRDPSVLAAP